MTQLALRHTYSSADYLATEKESKLRHEFYAGEICAEPWGSPQHAAMAAAITTALRRRLEETSGRCTARTCGAHTDDRACRGLSRCLTRKRRPLSWPGCIGHERHSQGRLVSAC